MDGRDAQPDGRGGGNPDRTDAFRFASGGAQWAFGAIGAIGAAAILLVLFDAMDSRDDAVWVVPAGLFLILAMIVLYWISRQAPVLLRIGPEGLDLPAALARPVDWREIWRIRQSRREMILHPSFIMLKIELLQGVRPVYKRRIWTWPAVDGWIARNYGLRVPLDNLDAAEEVILASVERFKSVQRLAA